MKKYSSPLMIAGIVYLICAAILFISQSKGGIPQGSILFAMMASAVILAHVLLRFVKDRRTRLVFNWVVSVPFILLFVLIIVFNFILPPA